MENEILRFENTDEFNLLLIKTNQINNLDYSSINYTQEIIDLPIYENIKSSPQQFNYDLHKYLNIEKFNQDSQVDVICQLISEEKNYIYELLYLVLLDKKKINDDINEVGNLINTKDEKIYGNAILMKTYLPSNSDSMLVSNIELKDIKKILDDRLQTKIVIYDDEWKEDICIGNIDDYAQNFFEDNFVKFEIPFLLHNINIWYEPNEFLKNNKLCGKLISKPVYKCIWFTQISDEYRGCITLEEVMDIIKISNHLEFPYSVKEDFVKEEYDSLGRKIIKNKYKILETVKKYFQI